MKKYLFVLGHTPLLSLAELMTIYPDARVVSIYSSTLVLALPKKISAAEINRLGGTVKIGEIIDELPAGDNPESTLTPPHLKDKFFAQTEHKIPFGISTYFLSRVRDKILKQYATTMQDMGFHLKRTLDQAGFSSRFVTPPPYGLELSSVVVDKNNLITKGAEIIIASTTETTYLARTIAVQDYEYYSQRDYSKPYRNPRAGMIPPKLAQILLNLAQLKPNDLVLDPFCGTGTILIEGLIMGYNVIGSDINDRMVTGANKNLEWFVTKYEPASTKYEIIHTEAERLHQKMENKKFDAIVTESLLGPPLGGLPSPESQKNIFKELERIIVPASRSIHKILKRGSRFVITLPAFRTGESGHILSTFLDKIKNIGYSSQDLIPSDAVKSHNLTLTERNTLIYDRDDQIVGREIIVLKKK